MTVQMAPVFIVSILLCNPVAAMAGTTKTKNHSQPSEGAPIRQEMGGLFTTISDLLPIVVDKGAFEDKSNMKRIAVDMNLLASLSKRMTQSTKAFADSDPSIPVLARQFSDDITFAIEMWNKGDRVVPYADQSTFCRKVLR